MPHPTLAHSPMSMQPSLFQDTHLILRTKVRFGLHQRLDDLAVAFFCCIVQRSTLELIYIHTHIHIKTYTHTHTHTHILANRSALMICQCDSSAHGAPSLVYETQATLIISRFKTHTRMPLCACSLVSFKTLTSSCAQRSAFAPTSLSTILSRPSSAAKCSGVHWS